MTASDRNKLLAALTKHAGAKAAPALTKCPCPDDCAACLDDAIDCQAQALHHLLCVRECVVTPTPPKP